MIRVDILDHGCDIIYGTNNEFGFDYLRDNMATNKDRLVQRDLHFAVIDEVDNVLIDEARTPLIISGPAPRSGKEYVRFSDYVRRLKKLESTPLVERNLLFHERQFKRRGV